MTHLVIKEAHRFGFVDEGSLWADTTAQELAMGYPNEPGILRGLAQRCGRALTQLQQRGIQGLDCALEQVQTILRSVKEHHLFTKSKADKRQVLTRLLREVGELMVQTRPIVECLGMQLDRVIQRARSRLMAMHEVIKPLMGQIVHGLTTGKVAANKIVHVGIPQARAMVRNKSGKKTEFGLAYLISRLGGGYVFGGGLWPMQTNGRCRSRPWLATGRYWVQKPRRSGWSTTAVAIRPQHAASLLWRVSRMLGFNPKASALGRLPRQSGTRSQRAGSDRRGDRDTQKQPVQIQQTEGTSLANTGDGRPRSILSFNLNKLMRDLVALTC